MEEGSIGPPLRRLHIAAGAELYPRLYTSHCNILMSALVYSFPAAEMLTQLISENMLACVLSVK